jgi:hypothetical protein
MDCPHELSSQDARSLSQEIGVELPRVPATLLRPRGGSTLKTDPDSALFHPVQNRIRSNRPRNFTTHATGLRDGDYKAPEKDPPLFSAKDRRAIRNRKRSRMGLRRLIGGLGAMSGRRLLASCFSRVSAPVLPPVRVVGNTHRVCIRRILLRWLLEPHKRE